VSDSPSPLHEIELEIRWGDMDALGHVNNATYFTYFEQVRIAWLQSIGRGTSVGGTQGSGPVVVNAFCNFRRAVVYPARLRVAMHGGTPGRSSFETYYEIRDADDPELVYATGSAKVVWVDRETSRSMRVPDEIRALLPVGE
jgi:acyl-CoA thioester hydrolase